MSEDVAQKEERLLSPAVVAFLEPHPASEGLPERVGREYLCGLDAVPALGFLEDLVGPLAGDGPVGLAVAAEDKGQQLACSRSSGLIFMERLFPVFFSRMTRMSELHTSSQRSRMRSDILRPRKHPQETSIESRYRPSLVRRSMRRIASFQSRASAAGWIFFSVSENLCVTFPCIVMVVSFLCIPGYR